MANDYWSRKQYLRRVKDYQADIRHARLVAQHENPLNYSNARDIVKSMVFGLRIHRLAYKVLRNKGGQK